MQEAIRVFFEVNEGWVAEQLEQGTRAGCLAVRVSAREGARMLVGALEGEMLVARAYADPARFASAAELLLAQPEDRGARGYGRGRRGPRQRARYAPGPEWEGLCAG
jgi:hypothetical protein